MRCRFEVLLSDHCASGYHAGYLRAARHVAPQVSWFRRKVECCESQAVQRLKSVLVTL